ncbi:NADPH:quinone reductase-like Zn-dependent oxidoreductase [Streptomyces sp. SAI-208]|uniref:NAD(P)-dependent alcohol dehydrogenase n=1 Tax=unclassified Streptomyces TaxID=2593676 RepID=UPI002475A05E|nr:MULTISPECIES: NAD(P)-dependent alcohol dehydrogenase [unclassified Streptomyces]MDH6546891.1 NADPH:quinone reductase-like Zn-dependent oxidoreductase [Streptomyces sp. SAI-041]MDH6589087.1 NADPH:quinone reductase-like Zn-dependent oxidoreductase [Streptomyces sp. SAI-133]MDH6605558.1 NADPH:quinone reductase-like Zn-dependent oxidoreductase [Streptomyces sp. SAI-208]
MKAVVQDRYGSADTLELREVEQPVPAADEVLVRVHAASVNAYDWHYLRGDPKIARLAFGLRAPKVRIRGRDFAGRVEAVGAQVKGLHPGDEVYGEADGTFAEFVCAKDSRTDLKPAAFSFEQAAAMPLAANTALIGLRDVAGVRAGQSVLVNGASGGVGTFAVQLAKAFGAEVTGVCSARNVELVGSLGADQIIDYTREDFTRAGRRYDVVLDLVGNRSLGELRRATAPAGTVVLSGGGVYEGGSVLGPVWLTLRGTLLSPFVRQRVLQLPARARKENLTALRELAEAGEIAPAVERTYPLDRAAEAIRHLEVEHARAKIVVTVPEVTPRDGSDVPHLPFA